MKVYCGDNSCCVFGWLYLGFSAIVVLLFKMKTTMAAHLTSSSRQRHQDHYFCLRQRLRPFWLPVIVSNQLSIISYQLSSVWIICNVFVCLVFCWLAADAVGYQLVGILLTNQIGSIGGISGHFKLCIVICMYVFLYTYSCQGVVIYLTLVMLICIYCFYWFYQLIKVKSKILRI